MQAESTLSATAFEIAIDEIKKRKLVNSKEYGGTIVIATQFARRDALLRVLKFGRQTYHVRIFDSDLNQYCTQNLERLRRCLPISEKQFSYYHGANVGEYLNQFGYQGYLWLAFALTNNDKLSRELVESIKSRFYTAITSEP